MRGPTIEEIKNSDEFAEYAASLRRILREILDWDSAHVDAQLDESLKNPGFRTFYLHDGPCYEAAQIMARERIGNRVAGLARVKLRQRLTRALNHKEYYFPDQNRSYDWDAARARIARVLKTYADS
jgi:hypothetical protein